MPDPKKLQAKLHKVEAEADGDRATLRAKAEKKIARIKNKLRAEEAKITARVERKREKTAAKLGAPVQPPEAHGARRRGAAAPRSRGR